MSQGSWRALFRLSFVRMLAGALVCAGLTACAAPSPRPTAPTDTLIFPDPEMATIKGGIFVGADQLAQVADGMSKPQVYAVLGVSHFNEGVSSGARDWNYLFNFRDSGDQVQQCQFMLQFDANDRVSGSHWKPASCEARLHREAPMPPPMATWIKPTPASAPAPAPAAAAAASSASSATAPVAAQVHAVAKPAPALSSPAVICRAVPAPAMPAVGPTSSAAVGVTAVAASSRAAPGAPVAAAAPVAPAVAPTPAPVTPAADVAPATPAAASAPVAVAPAAPVPLPPLSLASDAAFGSGSAHLSAAGRERLDSMLLQVQFPTDLHGIHVVGFSDRIGTRRGNLRLSRQRAEAVRRYLIEGGVPASEVIAEGRGEAEPQVQCSETGRKALSACLAPNRRVEITGMMVVPSTP